MNAQGFSLYKQIQQKQSMLSGNKKLSKKPVRDQFVQKIRKINLMAKVNTEAAPSGNQTGLNGNTANVSQEFKVSKFQKTSQQLGIQMPKISLKRIQNQQASAKNNIVKTPGKVQLIPLTSRKSKGQENSNYTSNAPFNKSLNNIQKMQEVLRQQKQNVTKQAFVDTTANTSIHNQYNFINNVSSIQSISNTQDSSQESTSRFRIKSQRSVKNIQVLNNQDAGNSSITPVQNTPLNTWNNLQLPIGPGNALKLFKDQLTDFEQSEILDYKQIYYIGLSADKIIADLSDKNNFGFDDEKGFYLPIAKDQVAFRYELVEMLGQGSFAQVLKCFDHKHKQFVALKIIRNKTRFHQQAQIEIRLLEHINQKDQDQKAHVIHAHDYLVFRKHIIIVFELFSMNLYELIRLNNFKGFPQQLIRRFATQLLKALKFMKKESIIHCDLKPENILLVQSTRSQVTVIDFGSACFQDEKLYTYIQSRFYRAPEIILGYPAYTTQIDMWSFGCILGELNSGRPMFPGESEAELFSQILEVKGLPPQEFINNSPKKKLFFDQNNKSRVLYSKKGLLREPGTKTLAQAIKSNDDIFLDFIEKCINYDPQQRLSPDQAMKHPWIADFIESEENKKAEAISITSRERSKSSIRKRITIKENDSCIQTERKSQTKQPQTSTRAVKL